MSLELCWTEQLGLNHCLGSQGTDIYWREQKVKCYQYLGVLAQKINVLLFVCFFTAYFVAVCWTNLFIVHFLRQSNLCTNTIFISGHRFKYFLREYFFVSKKLTPEKQSVLGEADRRRQAASPAPLHCPSDSRTHSSSARRQNQLQFAGTCAYKCMLVLLLRQWNHCPRVQPCQIPRRELLLLPHTFPELCWGRQRGEVSRVIVRKSP